MSTAAELIRAGLGWYLDYDEDIEQQQFFSARNSEYVYYRYDDNSAERFFEAVIDYWPEMRHVRGWKPTRFKVARLSSDNFHSMCLLVYVV